ncbi:unnamed protein product [Knipowitschia caucasica]|uniref:Gem-associated protein 8 n=1 Tax=Knipowitschia caucasica TaxID=637954 RepID=A0AAV2L7P7_KNICA
MEDHVSGVKSCFSSPVYIRYWQHYEQAMGWYQRHRRAYNKALQAAYGPAFYPQHHDSTQRYRDWEEEEQSQDEDEEEEDEEESSSDSDIECDVSNMEISEELREYFAQTEKHREELRIQQEMEQQQDDYVPADQDLHHYRSTVAPPTERPGERRTAEMKKLYGKDCSKIMAMEAAMQLSFDRNCDRKQPKYWPVIPLKL